MKNTNIMIAALVLTTSGIATNATAGPCDDGISLVNPLTGMVEIHGVDIGNGEVVNTLSEIGNDGLLIIRDITPGSSINPSNRFNPSTSQVELDCVISGPDTLRGTLNVIPDGNDIKLQVADAGNVFDVTQTRDWTINFNNDFPDEVVMFNTLNRANIPGSLGNFETIGDQITLNFGFNDSTSTFRGTTSPGRFEGFFTHRDQNGTFVATPSNPVQTAPLNESRFQVEVEWRNDTGSGPGDAILATDDSAAFFFFDPSTVDTLVRVFDGCAFNDHFWVFASAATNVEFTLTVTDTNSGEEKVYDNPLGGASRAITDTSAFATCP